LSSRLNAWRTDSVMLACNSLGKSPKPVFGPIACTSRSMALGTPLEAVLNAWTASIREERTISCIRSVADLVIISNKGAGEAPL